MREKLLGYLLGALEEHEQEEIERLLDAHPELRAQLEELSEEIEFLRFAEDDTEYEPAEGLADRACRLVDACRDAQRPMPASVGGGGNRVSLADVVVAAGVCLAVALFFFPAIASSRQQAQMHICQNNLRLAGAALQDFSRRQGAERFVAIPASGPRSFAGLYAPTLLSDGYSDEPAIFTCPGSDSDPAAIPTLEQLEAAEGKLLRVLQRRAGGDYAYNLGYCENGDYRTRCNQGSETYALLADAPSLHLENRISANHNGAGQNVLFESGRVAYVKNCTSGACDPLFVSDRGYVEAGASIDDIVLGRSEASPFLAAFRGE